MSDSLWPDTEVPIVPKKWGYEKIIDNNKQYCGKLLHFVANFSCSVHYHLIKKETFYLHRGAVEIYLHPDGIGLAAWNALGKRGKAETQDIMERIVLRQGQRLKIPIGTAHQIIALEDSELFEFSSEDFSSDSYRIIPSPG